MSTKRFLSLAVGGALLASAWSGVAAAGGEVDPLRPAISGLIDQNGTALDTGRFEGRYVLVNFIFTGCGSTCPLQTAELAQFERTLPRALRAKLAILSISVDPINDTPKKLRDYARAFNADRRWTFATGNPSDVARVAKAFGASGLGIGATSIHTSDVRLFDRRHRMIQRYAGAPLGRRQLRADLMTLAETQS